MLKLTNLFHEGATYVVPDRVNGVIADPGPKGGCTVYCGNDAFPVKESAEDVQRMVDEAMCRPQLRAAVDQLTERLTEQLPVKKYLSPA